MRDRFGDPIEVKGDAGDVRLVVTHSTKQTTALLSPQKARRLALKLLKAAEKAERHASNGT